jgi:transposase
VRVQSRFGRRSVPTGAHEEVPVTIVGGLDLHRRQLTFDVVDTLTGEATRGRVAPADRETFRGWLGQFEGRPVELAVEGCTGWRFVVEEGQRVGARVHLAEPADTAGLRGRRRHPKTDRLDARHLRELLESGRLPESWIPPAQVLEIRAKVRLYKDLLDERTAWQQRIHATQYHHGAARQEALLRGDRARLGECTALSPSGRQAIEVALRVIQTLEEELGRLRQELVAFGRRQPGCRELQHEYGIGRLTSVVIWCELGDTRRFTSSDNAVRHTGLDVSVYSSDGKRSRGRLTRQGPPLLRWALYEAGQCAARASSPDHAYYQEVKTRLGGRRAALSVARKLTRRCHHRLRALGDQAFRPV